MRHFGLITRTVKRLATLWLLVLMANGGCNVFATIDPNSYSVSMSMQNQNQGIEVMGGSTTEQYVGTRRTLSVSTNAPSGYRVYVYVPADEASAGNLVLSGGDSSSPVISTLSSNPSTATTLSPDTWGFGIPNSTSGLPTNNFSPSYNATSPLC